LLQPLGATAENRFLIDGHVLGAVRITWLTAKTM